MRAIHAPKTRRDQRATAGTSGCGSGWPGTAERPRLVVFRSLKHIYAQLVNDDQRRDAPGRRRRERGRGGRGHAGKVARGKAVGKLLAEKAKAAGVTKVVFDRAGYRYHGRVQAVADGAREGGLEF